MKKNSVINLLLKAGIVALLFFALYRQVFLNNSWNDMLARFMNGVEKTSWLLLAFVVLLMLVNWATEALKWKLLLSKMESVSFMESYAAIFAGMTFALFTPNRVGEYAGRLIYHRTQSIIRAIMVTLIGSFAQITVTFIMGLIGTGFFVFYFEKQKDYLQVLSGAASILLIIASLIAYFNVGLLTRLIPHKGKWLIKTKRYLLILGRYSRKELLNILLVSFLRYGVFTAQYIVLLYLFGVHVSIIKASIMIALIFFTQTVIPSIAILELGMRGSVAIFFLGYLSQNNLGILSASFGLWIINLVLPAIIGSIFILKSNLTKKL